MGRGGLPRRSVRTLVLGISIVAVSVPASASAQVPKGIPDRVSGGVGTVTSTAVQACPTWTVTNDSPYHREAYCEVAPAPGVAYRCSTNEIADRPRVYEEGCRATAGTVVADCREASTYDPYYGESGSSCTVANGDSQVASVACASDWGSLGGHVVMNDSCSAGPVTLEEHEQHAANSGNKDDSLEVRVGETTVRCDDSDDDAIYELEGCGLGQ